MKFAVFGRSNKVNACVLARQTLRMRPICIWLNVCIQIRVERLIQEILDAQQFKVGAFLTFGFAIVLYVVIKSKNDDMI